MKVINGLYKADTGEVMIDGKPVEIRDPIQARKYGIAMIAQELNYVPEMSIEENVFLGRLPVKKFGNVDWKQIASIQESIGETSSQSVVVAVDR